MILSFPGERHSVSLQPHSRLQLEVGQTQLEVLGEQRFYGSYGFVINAPAALVDPATIDINSERGYKGIREGEPLAIGRNHIQALRRFDHLATDPYLSRTHVNLLLAGGEIAITHASATSSTIINVENPANMRAENPQLTTPVDSGMSAYASAARFALHSITLQQSLHSDLLSLVADELYLDWYRLGTTYKPGASVRVATESHDSTQRAPDMEEELIDSNVYALDSRFSNFWKPGASHDTRSPEGRLFLNTDPAYVPSILNQLTEEAQKGNASITAKALKHSGNLDDRVDSCLVAFNGQDAPAVLQSIRRVHDQNSRAFREGIPQLTLPVLGQEGQRLRGVGFGQNPTRKRQSFGTSRCLLLAEALQALHLNREPITASTLWSSFGRLATRHDIDPQNPAFNFKNAAPFGVFRPIS